MNHTLRTRLSALILVTGYSLATPSLAADNTDAFQGLWVGTDPSDGGLQTWSIAANNQDGYQVRLSDTYLRACAGNRGTVLGTGNVDSNGYLVADLIIQCLVNPTNETYMAPIELSFTFKPHKNGYLEGSTASSVTQLPTTLFKNGATSSELEGVWSGTDPDDGGLQTWSIVRKGKHYQVRVSDTYLRTCNGNRGSILGQGTLDDNAQLNAQVNVQCYSNPTNETYQKPVALNFSFKWHEQGYLEASTRSGVTQHKTTLFKIANRTNF